MRVLHLLYSSFPDRAGGSVRSHEILRAQNSLGLETVAVSSPFQQPDRAGSEREEWDGVVYRRTYPSGSDLGISESGSGHLGRLRKLWSLRAFRRWVGDLVASEPVDVIHAHNNFLMARVALDVGRHSCIPVVYEVRSLWEERLRTSAIAPLGYTLWSMARRLEEQSVVEADEVVAINAALADDLECRTGRRAHVVGNAVVADPEVLTLPPSSGGRHIAYLGSMSPIEGLDMLVDAFVAASRGVPDATLSLHGGGRDLQKLRDKCAPHPNITVHGPFQYAKRGDLYRTIDLVVLPRLPLRIAHTVTPLKPLEAMVFGRPVLASDVGGHRELIRHGENGWLFRAGDRADLESKLRLYFLDDGARHELCTEIATAGRERVLARHTWSARAEQYRGLYHALSRTEGSV